MAISFEEAGHLAVAVDRLKTRVAAIDQLASHLAPEHPLKSLMAGLEADLEAQGAALIRSYAATVDALTKRLDHIEAVAGELRALRGRSNGVHR